MLRSIRHWHVLVLIAALVVGLAYFLWPVEQAMQEPVPVEPVSEPVVEEPAGFQAEEVSFAVKVKDNVNPYRVLGVFVMPGEEVDLEAVFTQGQGSVAIEAAAGQLEQTDQETWQWTAPEEPGLYPITVTDTRAGETMMLNAFVKVPYDHDGPLNGYRIGTYKQEPLRGNPFYNRPQGFVEVTSELADVPVSPHFTLGQFLCKQGTGWPKYLLLRERLLLKLEMILQEVNQLADREVQTLHVMSGFRTPYYNESIGNETSYSQHLYGGAADIFVDTNHDGRMDDLTGDGLVTVADARVLAAIVEEQTDETWYQPFIGGLGIYGPAPHRGPFIHVDVRGEQARWGA